MGYFRNWLEYALEYEITPSKWTNRVLLVIGAPAGGWIFAMTGNWLYAIVSYALAYFWLRFAITPFVEWLGEKIVKALLFCVP